jgi:hypothetical protein
MPFYDLLTLVDALRDRRARERELAVKLLTERLEKDWHEQSKQIWK